MVRFSLNLQTISQFVNSFKRTTINKVMLQEDTQSIGVLKGGIIGRPQKDKGSYRKRDILGKLQLRDSAGTSFPPGNGLLSSIYVCRRRLRLSC